MAKRLPAFVSLEDLLVARFRSLQNDGKLP